MTPSLPCDAAIIFVTLPAAPVVLATPSSHDSFISRNRNDQHSLIWQRGHRKRSGQRPRPQSHFLARLIVDSQRLPGQELFSQSAHNPRLPLCPKTLSIFERNSANGFRPFQQGLWRIERLFPRPGCGRLAVFGRPVFEKIRVFDRVQHLIQPGQRVIHDME